MKAAILLDFGLTCSECAESLWIYVETEGRVPYWPGQLFWLTVCIALNCYRKEALCALKEAIMAAHKVNDNVCLQHALAWLYKLSDENKVCSSHSLIVENVKLFSIYVMHKGFSCYRKY
jgi:hypothetical protein